MLLLLANVTVNSTVCDPANLPDAAALRSSELSVIAVADTEPPATAVARVAKSVATAVLIAIVSPVVTWPFVVVDTFV